MQKGKNLGDDNLAKKKKKTYIMNENVCLRVCVWREKSANFF